MADHPDRALEAGTPAPDFQLKATPDQWVGLEDFRGKARYGAYEYKEGVARRALFVLDAEGGIRRSYVAPMGVNRGAEGILAALEQMQEQAVGASL